MESNTSRIGTEFKIYVQVEPIDGKTLSELEFSAVVYTDRVGRRKEYTKEQFVKVNENKYAVSVYSAEIGPGKYFIDVTLQIPDTHFIAGYRKEVRTFFSGKEILP